VAVGMLVAGCTSGEPAVVQGGTFTFVSPGGKLEFSYPAAERQPIGELAGPVVSGESERISTKDHLGEVVVLNVWSTTCGPCRLEAVDLREAAATFSDQPVQFIGINVRDNRDAAADFEVSKGITYPSIEDPTMRTLLSIGGLPTGSIPLTLVLDKQGRVAQIWLRPVQRTELEATVRAVAAEI
jgi:thiol-disulfide isomerase/thioredoxin